MLTQARLKELLLYRKSTGRFYWKQTRTYTARAKTLAGSSTSTGYTRIKIDGKEQLAHRLAWLYVYGELPTLEIDHINGDRADNRLRNLRVVTISQQRANSKISKNNKSGFQGVCWNARKKKYRACLQHRHLGYFASAELAAIAYTDAFNARIGREFRRAHAG